MRIYQFIDDQGREEFIVFVEDGDQRPPFSYGRPNYRLVRCVPSVDLLDVSPALGQPYELSDHAVRPARSRRILRPRAAGGE